MDKEIFRSEWITVIDRDGYTFVRSRNAHSVAVLAFANRGGQYRFLARLEDCPAHTPARHLCSLTGGVEMGESPLDAAVRELYEESGYIVSAEDMIPLGQTFESKGSELVFHYFAVDVSRAPRQEPPGDGTIYEANATTQWIKMSEGVAVEDAFFVTGLMRLMTKLSIEAR